MDTGFTISYLGQEMRFDNKDAAVVWLRQSPNYLKGWEIGEIIKETKANVSLILKRNGLEGHIPHPELEDPTTFNLSDRAIAQRYRVPLYRVQLARKALGLDFKLRRDYQRRRNLLSRSLFGLPPGPSFSTFINSILYSGKLPPRQAQIVQEFYLQGRGDNSLAQRTFRYYARKKLKQIINEAWPQTNWVDKKVVMVEENKRE